MRKLLYAIPSIFLFLGFSASAATVQSVKGKVLINHGDGFLQTATGAQANAGDLLMASAGGSAKLVYPGGCEVNVIPGRVVSVGKQPPCRAPYLAGLEEVPPQESFVSDPLLPFGIAAATGWGIYCAATYCRDHHGGKPASP